MAKPSVFIGSSSEGRPVAEDIKKQLEKNRECYVRIWTEDLFEINESYFESLMKFSCFFDFAVLVLTPDDRLVVRHKASKAARDNVIFELGLFLGRLGSHRAFVVADESIRVLSDFSGIEILKFVGDTKRRPSESLVNACDALREKINQNFGKSELSMLPSTALAVGYYLNFVKKVHHAIFVDNERVELENAPVPEGVKSLTVIVPNEFAAIVEENLPATIQARDLLKISLKTPARKYPFYLDAHYQPGTPLELYDIPTTLLASKAAIEMLLPKTFIGVDEDEKFLEAREIHNFAETLRRKIVQELGEHQRHVFVREEE
jgi:hypothetical protein